MKLRFETMIVLAMIAILLVAGCQQQEKETQGKKEITPPKTPTEQSPEIVEKRGQQTNITDWKDLSLRASGIKSYKYILSDTDLDEERQWFVRGRWVKVRFDPRQSSTGQDYDEVFLDRVTKTALSHCSIENCEPIDKEMEHVDYEDYYEYDPYETMSRFVNAEFDREEMLGNDYTKVFTGRWGGNPATVWLQEYYGYPLKFEIEEPSGIRVIEYKDMIIDSTRSGETDTPFNFTVTGEEGHWLSYEHYLGLWPPKNQLAPEMLGSA